MSKRVVVTGAGGFLGRALTKSLANAGHKVLALDNDFRGSLATVEEHPNIERDKIDVLDHESLVAAFKGADTVFHLAAINGTENFYNFPDKVLEVGVIGTHNATKAVMETGVKEFFFASSSEVYNVPKIIPTPETIELRVVDVFNPRFSYGGGKLVGELIVLNYLRNKDVRFGIFRPHNVYGPQMGFEHVIPQLSKKILIAGKGSSGAGEVTLQIQGTGEETRSFIFIDDAVRAIETCTINHQESGLYHIGVGQEITIRELASTMGEIYGYSLKVEASEVIHGSPNRRCPDTTKISNLGFDAQVSLKDGLKRTLDWYREHYTSSGDLD